MATFVSNYGMFSILSDGHKLFLLHGEKKERECIEVCDPLLVRYNLNIDRPIHEVTSWRSPHKEFMYGLISARVSLEFQCGLPILRTQPIVMGVDIFDKLTVLDYISVINEKIKRG